MEHTTMLLFHRTATHGEWWAMSSDLTDLFPTMDEAIIAHMQHRLTVTEIGHPLDDPLAGTPVVDRLTRRCVKLAFSLMFWASCPTRDLHRQGQRR
jgi:hypothetical protein